MVLTEHAPFRALRNERTSGPLTIGAVEPCAVAPAFAAVLVVVQVVPLVLARGEALLPVLLGEIFLEVLLYLRADAKGLPRLRDAGLKAGDR